MFIIPLGTLEVPILLILEFRSPLSSSFLLELALLTLLRLLQLLRSHLYFDAFDLLALRWSSSSNWGFWPVVIVEVVVKVILKIRSQNLLAKLLAIVLSENVDVASVCL